MRPLSEADWQTRVIAYAHVHGWLAAHFRPTEVAKGRWITAMQGDKGFPDLVLSRRGVVLMVELKTDIGRVSPDQRRWIEASGALVWRPRDWAAVQRILAGRPGWASTPFKVEAALPGWADRHEPDGAA